MFKVGDRVKSVSGLNRDEIGTVVKVDEWDGTYFVKFDSGTKWWKREENLVSAKPTYPAIVITTDGVTTTAKLREGKKVVKTATAKCAPSDAFKFETGAELAFNRLVYGTDYNPAEVAFRPEGKPQQEPIKLYCVKSYEPGTFLTKGKTYGFNAAGDLVYDGGYTGIADSSNWEKTRLSGYTTLDEYLVPRVSRPAKVGEWVLVTGKYCSLGAEHKYEIGEIYKVFATGNDCCVWFADDGKGNVRKADYLVLDGYQPEPEKPKFYSGKVVCVEAHPYSEYTQGRVYTITDGKFVDDIGRTIPCISVMNPRTEPIRDLKEWNEFSLSKFIEYKGEA